MDSQKRFHLTPLPIEKEFRVLTIRQRLHELSREELEDFLSESLTVMAKLAHHLQELKDYLVEQGKIPNNDSKP